MNTKQKADNKMYLTARDLNQIHFMLLPSFNILCPTNGSAYLANH